MRISRKNSMVLDMGKFRDLAVFIPPTDSADGRGGVTRSYNVYDGVEEYVYIEPLRDTRSLQQANLIYNDAYNLYVRSGDYDPSWRVVLDGRNFTIHIAENVDFNNRFVKMVIWTKE